MEQTAVMDYTFYLSKPNPQLGIFLHAR